MHRAAAECDVVAATIFVNPLQFAANEDLDGYPRDLPHDVWPHVDRVDPDGSQTPQLGTAAHQEGRTGQVGGPGHLDGADAGALQLGRRRDSRLVPDQQIDLLHGRHPPSRRAERVTSRFRDR